MISSYIEEVVVGNDLGSDASGLVDFGLNHRSGAFYDC